jgi:hypothetical protein
MPSVGFEPSNQAAADLRLRAHGQRNRAFTIRYIYYLQNLEKDTQIGVCKLTQYNETRPNVNLTYRNITEQGCIYAPRSPGKR